MDRELNLAQSPVFGRFTAEGPARPAPLRNSSDFWAHGVSAGVEWRY